MRIGIDFDNTIISYDDVFFSSACDAGLIDAGFCGGKQAIRDAIRLLPDGDLAWQKLQGQVYGRGVDRAKMISGVDSFLRRCRREGYPVLVVSHKTEFGHYDRERVNLRQAALDWMKSQGFFGEGLYGIPMENVFFESTRAKKLARIASLGCTHFIDDLEEVLSDPGFPPGVTRILFSDGESAAATAPYIVCPTWRDIEESVFRGRA